MLLKSQSNIRVGHYLPLCTSKQWNSLVSFYYSSHPEFKVLFKIAASEGTVVVFVHKVLNVGVLPCSLVWSAEFVPQQRMYFFSCENLFWQNALLSAVV